MKDFKKVLKTLIIIDNFPKGIILLLVCISFYYSLIRNERALVFEYNKTFTRLISNYDELDSYLNNDLKIVANNIKYCPEFNNFEEGKRALYVHYFTLKNLSVNNYVLDSIEFQIFDQVSNDHPFLIFIGSIVTKAGDVYPFLKIPSPQNCHDYEITVKNLTNKASIPIFILSSYPEVPYPIKKNHREDHFNFVAPSIGRSSIHLIYNNGDILFPILLILFILYLFTYAYIKTS